MATENPAQPRPAPGERNDPPKTPEREKDGGSGGQPHGNTPTKGAPQKG